MKNKISYIAYLNLIKVDVLIKLCKDLKYECKNYRPANTNELCVQNSVNNGCEIKRCSDLTEKCEEFIPNHVSYKCALKGGACQITEKDCDELDSDNCNACLSI